ncbi:TPA: hypothetical protein ACHVKG_000803 [Bacillus cereus]
MLTELIESCLQYKMDYTSCPNCSNRVSRNTIKLSGVCNNCYCHRTLQRYKDDYEFLKSRLKDPSYASHVLNIINFVSKSKFSNVIKYRTVVNFIKVLNEINELKLIKEHLIEKIYFEKCAVKSPKILEIIKIYFYSLDLIEFDEVSNPFPNIDIRHTSRYRADILDYFFDDDRCSDCGEQLTVKSKYSFCYSCVDYRSLYMCVTKDFINENFSKDLAENMYRDYLEYLNQLIVSPCTLNEALREAVKFINFTVDYLPNNFSLNNHMKNNNQLLLVHNSDKLFEFHLSEKWLEIFNGKFKSYKKKHFIQYLIILGLIIENENKPKEKILIKIKKLPIKFQKSLCAFVEKNEQEIDNYRKKNASKEKKWVTVNQYIDSLILFVKWLIENYEIDNWSQVTDKEVNIYLLTFPEKNRTILKRLLFNFFEFSLKKRWIFNNPIEEFIARDFKVDSKPLSLKEHAQVYNSILKYKSEFVIEVFITCLVYFHSLTSKQISAIKLSDIKSSTKLIEIPNRTAVYLSDLELLLLTKILILREEKLKNRPSEYLFCSYNYSVQKSVSRVVIKRYVKKITGYTAKDLRTASIQYCTQYFGIEYVHQCIGLSLTQASRYGDIEDYLIDEIVEESINKLK